MSEAETRDGHVGSGWVTAAGFAALLPFVVYHAMYARLFWFGDEFDLIDQIDRIGFWHWIWTTFAENFVPVFKLLWGGAVLASGGSYAVLIGIGWLLHAANAVLLGRLMRICGVSLAATLLAQVVFGLTPANGETLGWSVQWSATLSMTFMLAALQCFFRRGAVSAPAAWAAASALSFSRGVLTGVVLALGAFLPGASRTRPPMLRRLGFAVLYLVPAVGVAAMIHHLAEGNHRHLAGHAADAAVFGFWCFGLNPLHYLLAVESWGWRTVVALSLLKLTLYVWALARSRGTARALFSVLVVFDLGNSVLLGIGRYHTGLLAVTTSRYQYAALVALMPIVGFCLSDAWDRLPLPRTSAMAVLFCLVAFLAVHLVRGWPDEMGWFSNARGTVSRRILLTDPHPAEFSVPGIPFMPVTRARQLIEKYHLH
jgi:hypothetical protein